MAGEGEWPAIGIDLGTTYSCVAVWQHDRVEIIVNDQGNRTTPSYVAFTDKERLVGEAAKNQVARNPANSVFGNLSPLFFLFSFLFLCETTVRLYCQWRQCIVVDMNV
jgi:molecular chaperone DnaK (HSP70)